MANVNNVQVGVAQGNAGNANQRERHPNGQTHIAIRDVQSVYGDVEEIPLQAWKSAGVKTKRGWNTMVTPSQVRAASDAWDARSVLHDIDTQWGMIPGGGAYKDSDHYFGPGEYDYY